MPWHFGWAFLPRHSKKLPAWAMSVRPKFNRPERTEAMPALPGVTDATASRKIRVLVLHSNRQNAQDFKTLGHAQTATFEIEHSYGQRKMFFVEAVTNGFVLYTRSRARLSFWFFLWLLIDAEKIQCLSAKCPFSFVFKLSLIWSSLLLNSRLGHWRKRTRSVLHPLTDPCLRKWSQTLSWGFPSLWYKPTQYLILTYV